MNAVSTATQFKRIYVNNFNHDLERKPLWYHERGLMQTATGYGPKLTTEYMINFLGKMRRVYCTQYSNSGSYWFNYLGEKIYIN